MKDIRLLAERQTRSGSTRCLVCRQHTTGGKPYCIDHIEQCDYAGYVAARLAEREFLEMRIRGGGYVSGDNVIYRESYRIIKAYGELTQNKLRQELGYDLKLVIRICKALRRKKLVTLSRNKRGNVLVKCA